MEAFVRDADGFRQPGGTRAGESTHQHCHFKILSTLMVNTLQLCLFPCADVSEQTEVVNALPVTAYEENLDDMVDNDSSNSSSEPRRVISPVLPHEQTLQSSDGEGAGVSRNMRPSLRIRCVIVCPSFFTSSFSV